MKIYFASDDIVHELEYSNKGGVPDFKFKQILQVSVWTIIYIKIKSHFIITTAKLKY
jgi:hypothetical protein